MKKILLVLVGVGIMGYLASLFFTANHPSSPVSSANRQPSSNNQRSVKSTSLFVPYWSLKNAKVSDLDAYNYVIYFGVAADRNGIDKSDPGYINLPAFVSLNISPQKYLTIRMINTDENSFVLKDTSAQNTIIQQSIATAKQFGFNGIVLDFETSGIDYAPVTQRVTQFYTRFSHQVHAASLPFFVTLYGDTYYRVRPFDVKAIAALSDQVLVMAYDFHKAHGNPGPNFPLHGKEIYGYDFATMVDDFLKDVPKQKLTFVFGMFGYDWPVDKDGNSTGMGVGISTVQIENTLVNSCQYSDCRVTRHNYSQEEEVRYVDDTGQQHDVWFEDTVSRQAKEKYLNSKGLYSTSLWAYSYF